jgi:DNA-binding NarL/FixJ family response regulator
MIGPMLAALIARRREERKLGSLVAALTRREHLALLGEGLGHVEIAAQLYISAETARTHIKRVLHKLGVHSRLEAAAVARSAGLIDGARTVDR